MTDPLELHRKPSEDSEASKPVRPSHQKIIENLERWTNSQGLQPPKLPDSSKTA
jgi:hypothetical protein